MHMLIQTVIVILLLSLPSITLGQSTARTSVSLIYEAIAATNATLWLAEDARLFQKYGLDAKVVHARGARSVRSLVNEQAGVAAWRARAASTISGAASYPAYSNGRPSAAR